jgi:tripartite-type tricarboxylate transporter receptor subunit TctC
VNIVRVPYKGTGPSMIGLMGGEVELMFPTAGSAGPHVKSGKIRALAVTSLKPSALAPGLPTLAESLPGYESVSLNGMFAPAKTPAAVIALLNQEVVRILTKADVKERLFSAGMDAVVTTPEEFGAIIKSEMIKWGKVIKDAGIRDE